MLTLKPAVVQYIVAEALVKTDLATFDPATIRSAGPLQPLQASQDDFVQMYKAAHHGGLDQHQIDELLATAQNNIALLGFGECVVRAKPQEAKQLLDTKLNSKEEGVALVDLVPTFSSCLDAGHQFVTDRQILRGVIAVNYYRLAYAPRIASR